MRFQLPVERVTSFKEYCIRRLTGGLTTRDLWALRDLDLTVFSGESVAIVGRNGAGKSTLLRVIARALSPTTGRVVVRGQVVPLLGLGAGFQADLSGRENIFVNATLLGHSRAATAERVDEIVEFAELQDFIHLPLRQFSDGMIARLGFAIGTMIRPDVLVLDEVLAVGDERFQERCGERIKGFCERGTTVLLVSHSPAAVAGCERAVWLDQGVLASDGEPSEVLAQYRLGQARDSAIATPAGDGQACPAPAVPSHVADGQLIAGLRQRCSDPKSVFCAFRLFAEVRQIAQRHRWSCDRVLELGPGCNPAALLCFLAGGSSAASAVGRVEPLSPSDLELVKSYLTCVGGFGWWRFNADIYQGELSSPICWSNVDISQLAAGLDLRPFRPGHRLDLANDSFSFAYSLGSLEHVPDPAAVIAELWRVLAPGAGTVHEINLGHLGFPDPLQDLRLSESEYITSRGQRSEAFAEVPPEVAAEHAYCNRWRTSDFVDAFTDGGFEILEVEPVVRWPEDRIDRSQLAEGFRSKSCDDLSVVIVRIAAATKKRGCQ